MGRFADIMAIAGIGILCLPIFLLLVPNIEQSRTEAQLSVAFNEVQRLHKDLAGKKNPDLATELPDLDPWGQPYRLVPLDADAIRVLSSGPNKSFSPAGIDDDDIYSDMPVSPIEAISAQKRRQSLLAVAASVGCWILASAIYLWRRRSSPD